MYQAFFFSPFPEKKKKRPIAGYSDSKTVVVDELTRFRRFWLKAFYLQLHLMYSCVFTLSTFKRTGEMPELGRG